MTSRWDDQDTTSIAWANNGNWYIPSGEQDSAGAQWKVSKEGNGYYLFPVYAEDGKNPYGNSNFWGKIYGIDITEQNTIEMKFDRVEYKAKFYGDQNSEIADPVTKRWGAAIALPTPEAPVGTIFAGWHTDAALTDRLTANEAFPMNGNKTVYAGWTENAVNLNR